MNKVGDIVVPGAVAEALSVSSKKTLLKKLAAAAARETGLAARTIARRLAERERLGSTGFGNGAAIPHARIEGLERLYGYFARLEKPVDFEAIDRIPVDLVFLLLSPPDAGAEHLKALARISRLLRDEAVLAKLRGARSRDAIYAVLAASETENA
ncbi:MAG: PTS sugar transporter subunit IIA [Sphingomonadaceae bacterium]